MKIYTWGYRSYDDVPEKYRNNTVEFVEDGVDSTVLNCGFCGEEFEDYDDDSVESCPHCNGDIIFPRSEW